ncbi:hypothetical protein [Clostridium kluyveri]|uniref:Uncharacterized protein n=2 Tax=Clostridium kluyveri TaxID=1534 RepID=A5N8N2_CLOK5|nr:hypothetical protein [Clostridium kluyveri]EDK33663.1 Conserved hypothetical protein [Clostridium kluyveri DSM 555]BAH06557.1 hypothetical protein CKR_1506 [Clostridium kluyveri NBRC 12016]
MYKKNYKMKKTISMKMFIAEFGKNFSEHMKKRLMELDVRCVLTRKEYENVLDFKHVEHTMFDCTLDSTLEPCQKEYAYGQLIVVEDILYFSEKCIENDKVMQSSIVNEIYNSLDSKDIIVFNDTNAKKIDDTNIDYVIDTMLTVYPEVSQKYKDIIKHMSLYDNK